MKRFTRLLRRLAHDPSGNVLMLTGLMFVILIAAGGAGIDFGRQQLIRTKLQQASDAGALAAASLSGLSPSYGTQDRENIALRYYSLNYPAVFLGKDRPAPTINGDRISVEAIEENVEAGFITAVNAPTLKATGNSVVQRALSAVTNYDVMLVLDNSGSMASVDVGTTLYREPSNITQTNNLARNGYFTHYAIPSLNNQMCIDMVNQFPGAYRDINDCIDQQSNQMYQNDTSDPNFFGTKSGTRLNALRYAANTLVESLMPTASIGNRVSVTAWGIKVYSNLSLTDNKAQVLEALDAMYALDSTNSTNGLVVAEQEANAAIADDVDNQRVRAVVLMTDGLNTLSGEPTNRYIYNGPGKPATNKRSDENGCTGRPADGVCAAANTKSLEVCTRLKSKGVQIYTIGMSNEVLNNGSAGQQAQAFLKACASPDTSNSKHYYPAATAAELNGIFQEILTQIQSLRITD